MIRLFIAGLFFASLLSQFSGCATTANGKALQASVKGFNENLRWKRFTGAATFVPAKERNQFIAHYLGLEKDLFIQNLEIRNVSLVNQTSEDSPRETIRKAHVLVMAEYYILPSTVVKREPITQEWEFTNGTWQMVESHFNFAKAD